MSTQPTATSPDCLPADSIPASAPQDQKRHAVNAHGNRPRRGAGSRKRPLVYDPRSFIVRNQHVPLVVGLSTESVWRYRIAGRFPPAIKLGDNSIGFRRSDLEEWLTTRESR